MIAVSAATAILLGAGLWTHFRPMLVPVSVVEPSRTGARR
ncbi:hypothetical protein EKH55_0298 [Sinorhizobium alkalisoli]|nr:hypothetical protein EKH55_0298 [Sinorhizobium alkalisoli]